MKVPGFKIYGTEDYIPAVGLGTFGSDHVSNEDMAKSVETALRLGYRHIDCASVYGNEKEIGDILRRAMAGEIEGCPKIDRKDLWITSKLWNDKHAPEDVIPSFRQSLKDLGLDYVDCYLVHWPFPNYHPPKCDVTSRSPNAKPYIHEEFMAVWREMEKLVDMGLTRYIGTSNMTVPKLKLLLRDCRIRPAVQEMELHPHFQQHEFLDMVKKENIIPIGFCPLGSPNRPERDKMADDTVDLTDPVVVEIAKAHGCHPAVIALKWAHANGIIPIPQSTKERNILSNLMSVCEDPLTAEEVERLNKIDRNCRLVKGHVFLWAGAKDWHDLWDEDGVIVK